MHPAATQAAGSRVSDRQPYSRVYWTIVDDAKFASIFDNDSHLAAWLRLLLIAEQAHPASAHLPANVRKASVTALAEAGLIHVTGSRYRLNGLKAERDRRSDAARVGGLASGRSRSADQPLTKRSTNVPAPRERPLNEIEPRRDETRRDEDETPRATANDPYDDPEMEAVRWLAAHGCDIRPGNGYHRNLVTLVQAHGINAVIGMFDRLAGAGMKQGDTKGYVFGAKDALDARTRPDLKVLEKTERAEDVAARNRRSVERTKVLAHDNGFHLEPNPGCPSCVGETSRA